MGGLSAEIVEGKFLTQACGSPSHAAPELFNKGGCRYRGPEIDVWSCGVILYILLCNDRPFDGVNIPELREQLKTGRYSVPGHVSVGGKELLRKMLQVDPLTRATIAEIRRDDWFLKNLPEELSHSGSKRCRGASQAEPTSVTTLQVNAKLVRSPLTLCKSIRMFPNAEQKIRCNAMKSQTSKSSQLGFF